MKIKTILEQVNGIYFANGKVNGVGWSDSPRLEQQEQRIKNLIRGRIVKILQERERYIHTYAVKLADEMLEEI